MTSRSARPILGLLLALLLALLAATIPAGAAHAVVNLTVVRGGADSSTTLNLASAGEAIVDLAVSAPGVSWGTTGSESAVVSLSVDGRYQSDLVVMSDQPTARSIALGYLSGGSHTLTAHFAADRSPAGATSATIALNAVRVIASTDVAYAALANAPVVYGRLLKKASPFANATTDTPLLAWHEATAATTPGDTVLEYSVVWSNEDGGTASPALMARWVAPPTSNGSTGWRSTLPVRPCPAPPSTKGRTMRRSRSAARTRARILCYRPARRTTTCATRR